MTQPSKMTHFVVNELLLTIKLLLGDFLDLTCIPARKVESLYINQTIVHLSLKFCFSKIHFSKISETDPELPFSTLTSPLSHTSWNNYFKWSVNANVYHSFSRLFTVYTVYHCNSLNLKIYKKANSLIFKEVMLTILFKLYYNI